jgi:outer membrane protein assembly factor BamB
MRHGLIALGLLVFLTLPARADDWPQWFGPRRDGVWREAALLAEFPAGGPAIRWRTPIRAGYAGPAVAGGRVYVTDRAVKPDAPKPPNPFKRITQPGTERVLCLDQATGKVLWTHEYDCDYTMSYSAGPRATPAVDGERVYTLGGEGDLICLDAASGRVIWSKRLSSEDAPTPVWGFAGHPLIDGERLICLTSGRDPAAGLGVVTAFNKRTGATLWTALSAKEPGYAPPQIIQAGGTRQLIVWHTESLNGLDPETGKVYWTIPFGPARQGVTILTPRFDHDATWGDVLMVATQYEGSMVVKLDPREPKASILWKRAGKSDRKTDALHSLICSPVIRDGHIYGVDIMGELRCLDLANGDRLWASTRATTYDAGPQKWATAFLIPLGDAGRRFLIPNEHGDLILADLDPAGYHEVSRAHLLEPTNTDPQRPVVWSFPALADRCVYWRNDQEIVCAFMGK